MWWNLGWQFRAVWKSPSLLRLWVLCLFQMAIFFLTQLSVHKCSSLFSVTQDLCPRLGKSPQCRWQSSAGDDRSGGGGMFWFVFENISEPSEYDWGSAFGVFCCCCCFVHLSLPLNTFEWLLPEIWKLFLDGFTKKSTRRLTLYLTLLSFFLGSTLSQPVS